MMQTQTRTRAVPEIIWCRMCGKIHRIRHRAIGLDGRPMERFLLSCSQCGKSEVRSADDIVPYSNLRTG